MIIQGQEKIDKKYKTDADENSRINYELFDYLSEIIETNRSRPHKHNEDTIKNETIHDRSWSGVNNYEEAEELALHGWKEAEENEQLNDIFNLQINDEDKLISFKNDVVGFTPVVPLVLQGIPNCMTSVTKKRVKSKIIHIVYNISTTCGTSGKEIMKAGIELFKVIMKLERQGYRVRLTAMQDFSNYDSSDWFLLNLKSEFKPLHITSMMFPLIHTAMFRVIGFAWFERSPVTEYKSGYGRNFTSHYEKEALIKALKNILKTDNLVYFSFKDIRYLDANDIIKKIKENK